MTKRLYMLLTLVAVCLIGCIDGPYSRSTGSFSLRKNDPVFKCTIIEEGVKKEVTKVCFWHEGYAEKEYDGKKYTKDEGGVHVWTRTYSEENKKMTAFEGAIDLSRIKNMRVVKKCGSKLYAPESMPGSRFIWTIIMNDKGEEKECLLPSTTAVRFVDKDGLPGGIPLVEVEEITDIARDIGIAGP